MPASQKTSFSYDLSGNMVTRDVPGGLSQYTWNGEDQLREATAPGGTEAYYYDHTGQRIALNATDGVRFWFGESEKRYPRGGGSPTRYVHVSDGGSTIGRLKRIGAGTVALEKLQYADALQNLTLSLTPTVSPTVPTVAAWFHYGAFGEVVQSGGSPGATEHRRQFNGKENDARTELRYYGARYHLAAASGDQTILRSYNALRQPRVASFCDGTPTCAFTGFYILTDCDDRGLVSMVRTWDPASASYKTVASYTRSLAGARTRSTGFNHRRDWTYDLLGRPVTDRVTIPSSGATWMGRTYAYRQSGDLGNVTGTTWTAFVNLLANASFTYDKVHRVKTAVGPRTYGISTLSHTAAGNITRAAVNNAAPWGSRDVIYTYRAFDPQAVDRLTNVSGGATYASFSYDVSGNMTYPPGGGSPTRYVHVSDGGSTVGRLKRVGTGTVALEELPSADALQNLTLSLTPSVSPTLPTVAAWFHYGAFGEVVQSGGSLGATEHRRQFNGKENDARTELRYYGARYYDALAMRWVSADPLYRFTPELAPSRTPTFTPSVSTIQSGIMIRTEKNSFNTAHTQRRRSRR